MEARCLDHNRDLVPVATGWLGCPDCLHEELVENKRMLQETTKLALLLMPVAGVLKELIDSPTWQRMKAHLEEDREDDLEDRLLWVVSEWNRTKNNLRLTPIQMQSLVARIHLIVAREVHIEANLRA